MPLFGDRLEPGASCVSDAQSFVLSPCNSFASDDPPGRPRKPTRRALLTVRQFSLVTAMVPDFGVGQAPVCVDEFAPR
jgi:hypothetical protein